MRLEEAIRDMPEPNRCQRCIMPDTVPGIEIDDNGVCTLCRNYSEPKYRGREALDKIVESIRGKGEKYDCIVPLSGGRDSSFVLHTMAADYGLRVLAVNYDNEFRAEQAVRNIHTACGKLKVDLAEIRSKRDIATKIVRGEIRHQLPMGLPGIIMVLCIACAYGYRSITYRQAEKHRVPLIVWGSSQMEKSEDYAVNAFDEVQRQSGHGQPRSTLSKLLDPEYYRLRWYHILQRMEFRPSANPILSDQPPRLNDPDIHELSLFDYVEWDRDRIKSTIMGKLGWRKPEDHASSWRTDCVLHDMVNYCYVNPLGCSKACFGYSNMINGGQMDRETALAQEQMTTGEFHDRLRRLLVDHIGLTPEEADRIEALREG